MNPIVSIILPVYKEAKYIELAIKSVQRQSFFDWELIVVDDGLDNNPKEIIETFIKEDNRIIYLDNNGNKGIQKSLNNGLKMARGRYIARIDDDDMWIDTDKLTKQVRFLEDNSEYVLVGTNAIVFDEKGAKLAEYILPKDDMVIRSRMLSKNCFIHSSVLIQKEAIDKVHGYDESEQTLHIEDYALWLKLGCIGKIANLQIPAVRLLVHSNSLTFKNRLIQAKRMLALICNYKKEYPNYFIGHFMLSLRIAGFTVLSIIPIPKRLFYAIQKLYKKY